MDDRPLPLRLVYSDELGQLKVVQTADGAQLGTAAVTATWGQPDKLQCIDCVALGSRNGVADTATAVLAVARCSGAIELLCPLSGNQLGTIPPASSSGSGSNGGGSKQGSSDAPRVRGMHLLWGEEDAADDLPAVLSVTQGGTARVHVPKPTQQDSQQQQQQQQQAGQGEQQRQVRTANWEERRSWQVPADVQCTAFDAASGRLAVGCQGAELRLFDARSGEAVFVFKGGKPNMVGLVDRPWNTALAFLPPSSPGGSGGSGHPAGTRVLVGTAHHKLRLYDCEAGKRPQMELSWSDARITCLALEPDGQRCWVGNGKGQIEVLDLQTRKFRGAIKGLAGSARALAAHPDMPVLASVGLDRYLRLHDRHTRQLLAKVYLKTLPTGVAFCPTDASMLPELPKERPADEKQRRRRRREVACSDGDGDEDDAGQGTDSEDEEEPEEPQQSRKSLKQRNSGSGKRRDKAGRKKRRAADDSD